jgi:phenylalanyl-tRNA synthetase alpha chain
MQDILNKIEEIRTRALAELSAVASAAELETWRIKYLGSKGEVKNLKDFIAKAQGPDKKTVGQRVNPVNKEVEAAFEAKQTQIKSSADASAGKDYIDVTEPGRRPPIGRRHVITQVTNELTELFARMGFTVASGPELEDDYHNFIALNIPQSHPARDPADNFYLAQTGELRQGNAGAMLMRTQTSTVQIRVMETQPPPIRVVIPGKVYRPDTMDATHLPMFHQLEALVVDKNVTMVDLKSTILQFVHAYFGQDTQVRFRPSFFPFTEPSAEVDVWFPDKNKWIELGGCGMVHPNVLKVLEKHGLNSEEYSGWAFGFGIDRIAMRKYAIPDIRMLIENDLRFLRQF